MQPRRCFDKLLAPHSASGSERGRTKDASHGGAIYMAAAKKTTKKKTAKKASTKKKAGAKKTKR
jgi:hypothetical protein